MCPVGPPRWSLGRAGVSDSLGSWDPVFLSQSPCDGGQAGAVSWAAARPGRRRPGERPRAPQTTRVRGSRRGKRCAPRPAQRRTKRRGQA